MRRKFLFAAFFYLILAVQAFAGPAAPEPIDIDQPDGTRFKARIHGDEFQNWVEATDSGHTVIRNRQSNHWEYAEKNPDGSLRGSGVRVSPDGKHVPGFIQRGLKPDRDMEREKQHTRMLREMRNQRVPALSSASVDENGTETAPDIYGAPGDWTPVPVTGTKNVLIVLVNFSNRSLITTPANWNSTIFDTTPGLKSVANYYKDNSFNTLTMVPAPHTQAGNPAGIVSVTVSDAHPNNGSNYNYSSETTILSHALAQAASYVNFAGFDTNGNGTLEQSELSIYFIYAGYEASGTASTPNIWAHAWSGSVAAGTKTVTRWALNGELNYANAQHPMGVIAHELGHALCGLPDLYDTANTNAGLGNYSLMAGGSWGRDTSEYGGVTPVALDAWSREYLGWTTPLVPGSNGLISLGYSLASANNAVKLVNSAVSTSEYWLAENRYATAGWDRGLRGLLGNAGYTGGLLITHIDITSGTLGSNDINRYVAGGHQGVMAEQASTLNCNMVTTTCRGAANTLFYGGNNDSFGLATTPNTIFYNGAASDLALSNISTAGTTMTLDYTSGASIGYVADGKADILWRNPTTGQNGIWFMDGGTLLASASLQSLAAPWEIKGVADFDGDGKADILWRNPTTGQHGMWFMNGGTRIGTATPLSLSSPWIIAAIADFDGDGKADILWRNPTTGQHGMWFMNGGTRVGTANPLALSSPWTIVSVADFDGDGKADILWRNPTTGQHGMWFMNGGTRVGTANPPALSSPWTIVAVADFDGDGKADILWRNPTTGQHGMWFMDGGTRVGTANPPALSSPWTIAAVADFDGDGKADILWRNPTTGQHGMWFMNGGTRISTANPPSLSAPWEIAGIPK